MDRVQILSTQLDRLLGFFPRNDARGALLLGVDLALASFLIVNYPFDRADPVAAGLCLASLLFAGLSCGVLLPVFFPDTRGGATRSTLYFRDIAATPVEDYQARIAGITDEELVRDLVCQIHRNAEILDRKHRHVRRALALALSAVPPLLLLLVWLVASGTGVNLNGA